jgi:dTDP-3-amino-2,3,6-trideoxy-4-keto-D-glucose/dTDP-3-amino-3,4,6-trideoxy-alpha-D-glucose/dTDP-2,6-dideoxy-D-kanosamine transaminase
MTLMVPVNDLRRQIETMRTEIDQAVAEVLESGWFVLGPSVSAFEREFAEVCGVRHCIGVANGTDALEIALRALGCGPGTEVVTVANAGLYATVAIRAVGATPVFAEIDPVTMTMDAQALRTRIGAGTAAIVVTHLYGRLADMEGLLAAASHRGIPILEDCAQAHGAERAGRKAGSFGTIGCFSFYPTKNLGALGDGGALTTNCDELAEHVKSLRQYGWRAKYEVDREFGRNSRLDELQAAILRVKLPRLEAWNTRRREIVRRYREAAGPGITVPDAAGRDHVAHLCVVRSPDRDALRAFLAARRIGTDIHYPVPDHRQRALRGLYPDGLALPHTDRASREVLTLPCFPEMTEEQLAYVCEALDAFGRGGER